MEVVNRGVVVTLEYEGEGFSGDYDPTDPNDVQLLRFSVLRVAGGLREQVEDASYCTSLNASLSEADQRRVCRFILAEVQEQVRAGVSIKKLCERLSWVQLNADRKPITSHLNWGT